MSTTLDLYWEPGRCFSSHLALKFQLNTHCYAGTTQCVCVTATQILFWFDNGVIILFIKIQVYLFQPLFLVFHC